MPFPISFLIFNLDLNTLKGVGVNFSSSNLINLKSVIPNFSGEGGGMETPLSNSSANFILSFVISSLVISNLLTGEKRKNYCTLKVFSKTSFTSIIHQLAIP